jgi:hypothetical protein
MSTAKQLFLPLTDSTPIQDAFLRAARNDAGKQEQKLITGKRMDVFVAISRAGNAGLTMREMVAISGRGINCWTQPFKDLRQMKVIEATDQRRGGGTVHRLRETVVVNEDGSWR